MVMDRKQRKAKKREEKVRKQKAREAQKAAEGITKDEKKSGILQLYIFIGVALVGAAVILYNV